MIFHLIWIVGVITFIVLCGLEYKRYKILDGEEIFVRFAMGLFTSLCATIPILILCAILNICSSKVYTNTFESQIYAKSNQYVVIESQSKAFKVYTDENNYIEAKQGETQIIDDGNASIIVSNQFFKSEAVKWLVGERTGKPTKYEIHIPKGTILESENKLEVE